MASDIKEVCKNSYSVSDYDSVVVLNHIEAYHSFSQFCDLYHALPVDYYKGFI